MSPWACTTSGSCCETSAAFLAGTLPDTRESGQMPWESAHGSDQLSPCKKLIAFKLLIAIGLELNW